MLSPQDAPPDPFPPWLADWWKCAPFDANAGLAEAIERAIKLCDVPIGDLWHRAVDRQLLSERRYRRRDFETPHPGEHTIEKAILAHPLSELRCFAGEVIDGFNAVPLARDAKGGRSSNVEADVALRVRSETGEQVLLVEVKDESNNAWYGAIENLLQLRLANESGVIGRVFAARAKALGLPVFPEAAPPLLGVVLGPPAFYESSGAKQHARTAATALLDAFAAKGLTSSLTVWHSDTRSIELHPDEHRELCRADVHRIS